MNENGELVVNATDAELEIIEGLESWDGVIKYQDIEELLSQLNFPEMENKCTMTKPRCSTTSTQTDESSLQDMERIPLKTVEKIKYVPFPMPIPVFIPVPTYLMETPVPYPFPLPLPLPVPIPVICGSNNNATNDLPTSVEPTNPDDVSYL